MTDQTPSRMISLALDASAGPATAALFIDSTLHASRRIDRHGSAELLAPMISELLSSAVLRARDLTDVIVGAGPGSFTGLRVVAALAKGLARGAGATLHAVPSLPLIAAAMDDVPPGVYLTVLDALRGEWFVQRCTRHADGRWSVDSSVARMAIDAARAEAVVSGASLVGPPVDPAQQPDARSALRVGATPVSRDAWEPDYGRLAEAQVKWESLHARPMPRL